MIKLLDVYIVGTIFTPAANQLTLKKGSPLRVLKIIRHANLFLLLHELTWYGNFS